MAMTAASPNASAGTSRPRFPPQIKYIVGNEACERFSFYGMRAILSAHLVSLYLAAGNDRPLAESLANSTTHLFFAAVFARATGTRLVFFH